MYATLVYCIINVCELAHLFKKILLQYISKKTCYSENLFTM